MLELKIDIEEDDTPDTLSVSAEYKPPRRHKFTNVADEVIMSQGDQESMETD